MHADMGRGGFFLSLLEKKHPRITLTLAEQRNEFVAILADEATQS